MNKTEATFQEIMAYNVPERMNNLNPHIQTPNEPQTAYIKRNICQQSL